MRLLLPFLLGLAAGPALAQDEVDCANAVTQLALNLCAGQDYAAADDRLNAVYARAMRLAEADGEATATALRDAQRLWVPFRDAACAVEAAAFAGGSMAPMMESFCLRRVTEARVGDLEAFVANMETGG